MRPRLPSAVRCLPWKVVIRWGTGTVFLGLWVWGYRFAMGGAQGEAAAGLGAIGHCLFGAAALILSAVCFAPNMASCAAAPLIRLIDSIYLGGGDRVIPPVEYKLARMYAGQGRAAEALDEYLRIVIHHPRESDAYREAIIVAIKAGDVRLARWLCRRAARRLRDRTISAELRSLVINAKTPR